MDKKPRELWLSQQGYRPGKVPPRVTWYGHGKTFTGATDNYTVDLNRSKGYVLDRKFLDPQLWHDLEYGTTRPSKTVEPPQAPRSTPRLASAMRKAMSGRDSWEGTPLELLSMIGEASEGIPTTAVWLSIEVMKPHITDALETYGITVERKRTGNRRLLRLSRSVGT